MAPEQDYRNELNNLQREMADTKATARVTKHEVANVQQALNGFDMRFSKFEDKISDRLETLAREVAGINVKQERGAGFFAGVTAVIVVAASVLMFLGRILFGGGHV